MLPLFSKNLKSKDLGFNSTDLTKKQAKDFKKMLRKLMGLNPKHLPYYIQAITHSSVSEDFRLNNERLEYLGDAILGAVIAEYLYLKYPTESEGFLTEMRSKIVSRQSLNHIAKDMGMLALMNFNKADENLKSSNIFGNALESLIGAIYLDRGYNKTKSYILNKILKGHVNMEELEHLEYNLKNKIISWALKHDHELQFDAKEDFQENGRKVFYIDLKMNDEVVVTGTGYSKKEASEMAAKLALEKMELI